MDIIPQIWGLKRWNISNRSSMFSYLSHFSNTTNKLQMLAIIQFLLCFYLFSHQISHKQSQTYFHSGTRNFSWDFLCVCDMMLYSISPIILKFKCISGTKNNSLKIKIQCSSIWYVLQCYLQTSLPMVYINADFCIHLSKKRFVKQRSFGKAHWF